MHIRRYAIPLLCLGWLCFAPLAAAQDDCPAFVRAALEATSDACDAAGRNQACYGHLALTATPAADAQDFSFEREGDIEDVVAIGALQLMPMSIDDETWGIALMRIQANLPDTLPGQNVTFLMFGDVYIANAAEAVVELPMTAAGNVNIRLRPTTDENNVIASLTSGQDVIANGRLADSSWVRIVLPDDSTSVGWVSASLLTSEGDPNSLLVVEPGQANYGPMQAFYFRTGVGDRGCTEAPASGILVQTPEGAGRVELQANGVNISIGSTIYMQANGDFMLIWVLEGSAIVEVDGVRQGVPAGARVRIPVNDARFASGPPEFPTPYNLDDLRGLSLIVDVSLPQSVAVTPPIAEADLETAVAVESGLPPSGHWRNTNVVTVNTCDPSTLPVGNTGYVDATITFSEDRSTFYMEWLNGSETIWYNFIRTGENTYSAEIGPYILAGTTWTLTFTSPTTYVGQWVSDYRSSGGCGFIHDSSGVFVP